MSLAERVRALGLEPRVDEPIARHGFWRLGGPADVLVEIPTVASLQAVLALGSTVTVLGKGSNLLVSDRGIRGVTVILSGELRASRIEGNRLEVGAGVPNAVLLQRLSKLGLGGLGALAGVPGTVGGAIRMNAGTRLGEVKDALVEVEIVTRDGAVMRLPASALAFAYRWATLPEGAVITRAWFEVSAEVFASEQEAMAEHLAYRKATQPLELPSCGSVFKNPPGHHAGKLIEAAGLKGRQQGGAQVSDKHANFIVNLGGATAEDVAVLVRLCRDTVRERTGIVLVPEVHAVGDWPSPPF